MHLLALSGLYTDQNDRFPFSFIYLKPEKKAEYPYPGTETNPCSKKFFKNHNCGTQLGALLVAVLTVLITETISSLLLRMHSTCMRSQLHFGLPVRMNGMHRM